MPLNKPSANHCIRWWGAGCKDSHRESVLVFICGFFPYHLPCDNFVMHTQCVESNTRGVCMWSEACQAQMLNNTHSAPREESERARERERAQGERAKEPDSLLCLALRCSSCTFFNSYHIHSVAFLRNAVRVILDQHYLIKWLDGEWNGIPYMKEFQYLPANQFHLPIFFLLRFSVRVCFWFASISIGLELLGLIENLCFL